MIRFVFVLFCSIVLMSCASKVEKIGLNVENKSLVDKIESVFLKGETIACDSTIWGTDFVALVDKEYIVMQSKYNNSVYWLYELKSNVLKEVGSFLKRGDGPHEMLKPHAFYDKQMNKLYLYDFVGTFKSVYEIKLDNIKELFDTSKWEKYLSPNAKSYYIGASMSAINDTTLLMLGSNFNSSNLFSILNLSDASLTELKYSYPQSDGTFNMEPIVKQGVYMDGKIAKHPFLDKIVYSCGTGRYVDVLLFSDTSVIERIPLLDEYPKYASRDGLNRTYAEDCLSGVQVKVTANAIYVLLSPLTIGDIRKGTLYKGYPNYCSDELFVFDWEGKLLHNYNLDIPIHSYLIDDNDEYLLGIGVDLEEENPIIRKYKL